MKLSIKATKPQLEFYHCQAKYPAFVAGFGSGKSEAMSVQAMRDAVEGGGGSLIGMYAPTYELIKMITAPRIESKLDELGLAHNYHKGDQIVYTSRAGIGDFVMRTMMNPQRIVGYETFRAHIDELDTLPELKAKEIWDKVIARNRQKVQIRDKQGNPILMDNWRELPPEGNLHKLKRNRVSVYTTPEGFRFVYRRWDRTDNPDYQLIRASSYSNPWLPEDYIQGLRDSYPPQLVDAYIDGLFVNLTSGAVYRHFDRKLNGCNTTPFPGEDIHVGMDFNYLVGCAGIFVIRDGEHGEEAHQVDEIHHAYDTDDQIAILKDRYGDHRIHIYPDATGTRNYSSNSTESDIAKLKQAGFKVHHNHANPQIRDRVNSVNGMICSASGIRRLFVNTKKCPHSVDGYEQQVYDSNGMPDKSSGHDHMMDGNGYFINFRFGLPKAVKVRKLRGI